ncbi:hypothetical protein BDN70DRAFT_887571 [Pholiota conissans]|uniref:SAP domain-containing protein n=1 Tax=Pholiota conissans TaxID=109636 RepID=A0A9P5YNN4_9AGAR|nr:hypothetical protein BDN70DRAFT_887571 [Pholiota conissans]
MAINGNGRRRWQMVTGRGHVAGASTAHNNLERFVDFSLPPIMAPVAYSGALPPKKKSELQEIASALRLSDQGTKDELQARIKKHLDANQDALEDDPAFAGLFGRRRRSVQPQSAPAVASSGRFALSATSDPFEKPKSSSSRRALDAIKEDTATPSKDLRDVSMFLKNPLISPAESTPVQSPRQSLIDPTTPSSLPPLPPSAPASPTKIIVDHLPNVADVRAAVESKQQQVLQNGNELLVALRAFLSNSRNIWSVTSVFELFYILSVTIPWKGLQVPVGSGFTVPYPPLSVFQSGAFWQVLLQWAIPSMILPTFVGCLISFSPALPSTPAPTPAPAAPVAPLDPLTAAIVRLAAQTAYPYTNIGARVGVVNLDVLGSQWRVLSASVGLAFAFAEAILGTPQVVAKTLVRERRSLLQLEQHEREATPVRRALMPAGEE